MTRTTASIAMLQNQQKKMKEQMKDNKWTLLIIFKFDPTIVRAFLHLYTFLAIF